MTEIKRNSIKTNHKKGIAAARKAQKRAEAEARNEAYQKLSIHEKHKRNSTKVRRRLAESIK